MSGRHNAADFDKVGFGDRLRVAASVSEELGDDDFEAAFVKQVALDDQFVVETLREIHKV